MDELRQLIRETIHRDHPDYVHPENSVAEFHKLLFTDNQHYESRGWDDFSYLADSLMDLRIPEHVGLEIRRVAHHWRDRRPGTKLTHSNATEVLFFKREQRQGNWIQLLITGPMQENDGSMRGTHWNRWSFGFGGMIHGSSAPVGRRIRFHGLDKITFSDADRVVGMLQNVLDDLGAV